MKPFSILILFCELASILLVASSADDYDITKDLNDIIRETLNYLKKKNAAASDVVKKLFTYDYSDVYEIEPYVLRKLIIYELDSNGTSIYYSFRDNKIQIYSHRFLMKCMGHFRHNDTRPATNETVISFKIVINDCLLTAEHHSKKSSDLFHPHKIHYEYGIVEYDYSKVLDSKPSQLDQDVKSISLSLLKSLIERNEKQYRVFSKGFDDNRPRERIILNHPTFSNQEEKYYYAIPEISIGSIHLTDIVARGLSNICSANYVDQPKISSLLIRNISGSMTARTISDLGSRLETRELELAFQIDFLYISVYWQAERIIVEAEKYTVREMKSGQNLSENHSLLIMENIQSAIASAIMPSMAPSKISTSSPTIGQSLLSSFEESLLNSEKKNVKSISKLIPNQHKTTKTDDERTLILNNYLTINLLSAGNHQYPPYIQCPVINNSVFTRRISLDSLGKRFNNSGPNNLDIHFHFNVPSLNISTTEPSMMNNSNSNNSCQLQIRNDQDIKVEMRTSTNNSTIPESSQQLKIKKQINSTLLSMAKERIARTMKSTVFDPFDICTESVRMVDEFFQRFASKVLKKCSFLRNNKTRRN